MPRSYCGGLEERASFTLLFEEIAAYGAVFDRAAEAEALVSSLQERIDTAAARPHGVSTAAVLYASAGGGPVYAYGAASMATAQLDALGIENVFSRHRAAVFESGAEPLLAADPDLLIVLHEGTTDEEEMLAALLGGSRFDALRAVREKAVLPLLFNSTEPASPLIVDGLERIGDRLAQQEPA